MLPLKNALSFPLGRRARFSLLTLVVFSTTVALSGQTDIYFKRYELDDRFAEEYIWEIIQDRRG